MNAPTETPRRAGAEIVFLQQDDRWVQNAAGELEPRGRWTGRLVNPNALDHETGARARYIARIEETRLSDGTPYFETVIQGHNKHARRYGGWRTLSEAQAQISAWARRRFYVEF